MVELVGKRAQLLLGVGKARRGAARGEAMATDKRRLRRRHHRQIGGLESLAVDHAEIALYRRSHPFARTEGVFAADVEWQLRLQLAGIVSEKAGETAKMVIMPMAQHKRVEACGPNSDERQIVV